MRRRAGGLALLFVLFLFNVAYARDFYDILSVNKRATDAQIKRAYRKLALQYHPDKVKGSDAEKKAAGKRFAEISHAYDVLSDEEKRKIYDRYGEEGLKQREGQGGGGGGPGDIFSQFFGGGFGFGGGQQEEEETPKGNDVFVELEATLKDLYLGATLQVTRVKNIIVPAKGTRECNCRNKLVTRQLGPGMFQQYTTQECEQCQNVKFEHEVEEVSVHVEPGMRNGQEIVFFEEGEPMVDGEPGDLKFVVVTAPDRRFQRSGADLYHNATISLVDALVGFSTEVEHLDGHWVKLEAAGVTRPGDVKLIKGEGMPVFESKHKGDLYVTYTVAFPAKLTEEQKTAVRALFPAPQTLATAHEEL